MLKLYLWALIPGALIYWALTGVENIWYLLLQGRIGDIVNILIPVLSVSAFIFIYGLIVEVTGPHVIDQNKKEEPPGR